MQLSPWRYLVLLLCLPLPAGPAAGDWVPISLNQPWQVASGLLPTDLAAQYQVYYVEALPQDRGLRWVVTSRGNTAELYSAGPPLFPATVYRATVSLESGEPVQAALACQGYDNAEQTGTARLLAPHTPVTLAAAPGRSAARRLALLLTGLQPGQKYVVDWTALEGDAVADSPLPAPPPPPPALSALPSDAVILDTETLEPDYVPPADHRPHLYRVPAPCAFSPYGQGADEWLGPGQYDYRDLDARLAALAARDPQAQVLLQVAIDSPPWWEALHPEALVPCPPTPPDLCAERKLTHASWYSPVWREAARQALQSLVKHVESSPWAGRVLGYELESGRAGRWVPWHQAAQFQETSPAAQMAFRTWLQAKYGSLTDLREAWGQPRRPVLDSPEVKAGYIFTQWAQLKPPSIAYMLDPKSPTLYDPSGQQDLADYQQFLGEYTAQVILDLVRAGRELSAPSRLWGACYGHLLWWPPGDWPPSLSGQLGLGKLAASDEINFLVGPPGTPQTPTTAVNSLLLRGKAYLEQPAESVTTVAGGAIFPTAAQAQHTTILDPEEADRTADPPWALVLDERSLSHLSPGTDLQRVTLQTQARELGKIGRPEVWLTGDLPASDPTRYGGYLMAATYFLPDAVRAAITVRARRPGTVTVWLYAAGALDSGYIDPSAIFRLTGLKATILNSPGSLRVQVPPGEPFFTPESDTPLQWGPLLPVQPRFVLVSGDETVGTMPGSPWPGLGLAWKDQALTVYSAAPGVPGAALKMMAEEARRRAGL